jgi:hypothetical protein
MTVLTSLEGKSIIFRQRAVDLKTKFRQDQISLHKEIRTFVVKDAVPAFAKAANPEEFKIMLHSLLTSAGLEIATIVIEKHKGLPTGKYGSAGGSRTPTERSERHDFSVDARANHRSEQQFYWLEVRGKDPDCICNLFNPLFDEAFKQAANKWFSAKL